MKILYPTAYRVQTRDKKCIGTTERLIDAVILAQDNDCQYPDSIKIFSIFGENDVQLVPKEYYSIIQKDIRGTFKVYRWANLKFINSAEKKVYRLENLRVRKCWHCNSRLDYKDFRYTNSLLSEESSLELWESSFVELYCCSCFSKIKEDLRRKRVVEERRRAEELYRLKICRFKEIQLSSLSSEDKEKLELLEEQIGKPIPPVTRVDDNYHTRDIGFIAKQGKISGLSLYYYALTDLPEALKDFSSIEYLDLSGNLLTNIPDWIESFENLNYLNLMANRITIFPKALCDINSLEILNLSGNKLSNIPPSIMRLSSLKYLYLWANQFNAAPVILGELKQEGINIVI